MIFQKSGFTLMEIIIVLIIVGVALAFGFPNYITSTEQARSTNAQNNLLAIYSAEKNYLINNNGSYCYGTVGSACADNLADINTNLNLKIQDDGTYSYNCPNNSGTCTATRKVTANQPVLTLTLTQAVNVSGGGTANPACTPAGNAWCPPN